MTLVYILSEYEEHGAEKVVATLDPDKVTEMLDENWEGVRDSFITEAKRNINLILEKDYSAIINEEGWECHGGWGGIQLHVVELT